MLLYPMLWWGGAVPVAWGWESPAVPTFHDFRRTDCVRDRDYVPLIKAGVPSDPTWGGFGSQWKMMGAILRWKFRAVFLTWA